MNDIDIKIDEIYVPAKLRQSIDPGNVEALAESILEAASKEQLTECARILALSLAHCQNKHGESLIADPATLLNVPSPDTDAATILTSGVQILVGVLANIMSAGDGATNDSIH